MYTYNKMCGSHNILPMCVASLMVFLLFNTNVVSQRIRGPASDFSKYTLVQPTVQHGRTKREIASTRDTIGTHLPEVTLALEIDGVRRELDLRLNTDLIADGHVLRYQQAGRTLVHKPTKQELDLCQYSGSLRGSPRSWAAVSTCRGLRGVIYDGEHMIYIEPVHESDVIQSPHYLYFHADLKTTHDPLLRMKNHAESELKRSLGARNKRSTEDTVHIPYNANVQSRYVELVLVVDRRVFQANGGDLRTVHARMKDVANIINSFYAPLNIFIALVGVMVWNEKDHIHLDPDSEQTLSSFLKYRRTKLAWEMPNDFAQLLTGISFNEGVIGKAPVGLICSSEFSGGLASNHSEVTALVAVTIAHEMGHSFGMGHDDKGNCTCLDNKCIMSSISTRELPRLWSSCNIKSLMLTLELGMDYCLRNKPKRLFGSSMCGNGFIEVGEQCDCGLVSSAEHTACTACCLPHTCMLRSNATCGAGACCDLQTCRPRAAGTECRAAGRECDLPEYCSGHSEFCPRDVHKMDSTPCGAQLQAYCVRGSCRSHSDQCRLLWGTTGETSHDKCYTSANVKGNQHGNCGYDRLRQTYVPCAEGDARCGLLQCRHLDDDLKFGKNVNGTLSGHTIITNGNSLIHCQTVLVDLGLNDVDPGMVPDGAKCGYEKMCLKQRCVPVAAVRRAISLRSTSVCPSTCSEHGVCNSEGHCHCDSGFAPPLCSEPGPGGSYDSGPASDLLVQRNFMVAIYVIFLGIVPAVALALFLVYYSRCNLHLWRHKLTTFNWFSCKNNDFQPVPQASTPTQVSGGTKKHSLSRPDKNTNTQIKKFERRLNKEDIQIVSNAEIGKGPPRPPVKPKPVQKATVEIVMQGPVFTTNEMLAGRIQRLNHVRTARTVSQVAKAHNVKK